MSNNKVKFGLKNVHYAKATIDETTNTATYATPVAIPGAVNLSMDPQGERSPFRADNIDYWVGYSNSGYDGDLEIALMPDSFKKDILGYIEDSNGVLIEDAGAELVPFALLFQFEGDKNAVRHVLYNCTATRPTVAGATTESTITPQTDSIPIQAIPIHNSALNKDLVKASVTTTQATQYNAWFDAVYQSSAV